MNTHIDGNNITSLKDAELMLRDPAIHTQRETSNWICYLFGNKPDGEGMAYTPPIDQVPNWFVRWMMGVMLGCMWIKNDQ